MSFRSLVAAGVAILVLAGAGEPLPAADGPGQSAPPRKRLSSSERTDAVELIVLADKAIQGLPAGQQGLIEWQAHFLRGPSGTTYVPFTLLLDDEDAFRAVAVYVRVTARGERETSQQRTREITNVDLAAGSVPVYAPTGRGSAGGASSRSAALRLLDRAKEGAGPYPFEDFHFVQPSRSRADDRTIISRALALPGGRYDLYVVLRERENAVGRGRTPRSALLKLALDVPDYSTEALAMSSPIAIERIDQLARPLGAAEQAERPYALGSVEIMPALGTAFAQVDTLSLLAFLYNVRADGAGKPNVLVEYRVFQVTDGIERFFNQTAPQQFNAATVPPDFDLRSGPPLAPRQEVRLASLPLGEYRLEMRVTDRLSSQVVTGDLRFVVASAR